MQTPTLPTVDEARRYACVGDPLTGMPGNKDTESLGRIAVDHADRYNAWSEALWRAEKYDASTLVFRALNREGYGSESRDCLRRFAAQLQREPGNSLAFCRLAYMRYCTADSPRFHQRDLHAMRDLHNASK